MGAGYVGVLSVDLHLPEGASLKGKRSEVRRVKAALAKRLACAVAEVDHHDVWQRARLTLAVVTRDAAEAQRLIDAGSRMLHADGAFQVVGEAREIVAVADDDDVVRAVALGRG